MKHLLLLLCIGCIGFISCDRRATKQDALKESIKTFRNADSALKNIKVFPETYAEVENDTILSNGYRVKIKNFTNMHKLVELPIATTFDDTQYFRQIDSEITVYKDNKLIFKDVISNEFSERFNLEKIDVKQYLNNGISVDELASLEMNKVVLITSNTVPKNSQSTYYKMIIDAHGNSNFKEIENART